jgi:hypothetical protein
MTGLDIASLTIILDDKPRLKVSPLETSHTTYKKLMNLGEINP